MSVRISDIVETTEALLKEALGDRAIVHLDPATWPPQGVRGTTKVQVLVSWTQQFSQEENPNNLVHQIEVLFFSQEANSHGTVYDAFQDAQEHIFANVDRYGPAGVSAENVEYGGAIRDSEEKANKIALALEFQTGSYLE